MTKEQSISYNMLKTNCLMLDLVLELVAFYKVLSVYLSNSVRNIQRSQFLFYEKSILII